MNKIKKAGIWYFLLNKRFLKKKLFAFLLLSVPLLVIGMRTAAAEDSGVLRVILCREESKTKLPRESGKKEKDTPESEKDGKLGESTDSMINRLLEKQGVIRYQEAASREEACELVRRGKADCAWEFPEDLQGTIRQFINGEIPGVMKVYVREDNVQTRLAREQVYGLLYPLVSYETVREFIQSQPQFADFEEGVLDQRLMEIYGGFQVEENIFRFSYLDGTQYQEQPEGGNYLTAPLRGMLAVLVFLCALAVTLFYIQEEKEGIFQWMPIKRRNLFPWLYILTGTLDAGAAAFLALYLSGSFTQWTKEILLMLLYVLAAAGFCNLLRIFTGNLRSMGAAIPVLILVTLVLCPVFLSTRQFPLIQRMLPAYYYLNSLYDPSMMMEMILYTITAGAGGILLSRFKHT
ncbi:MAG: hypothetical protein KH828_00220 [Clostridiales bacterium]|nr:hypothetical protein [Clostridiales bacterium]